MGDVVRASTIREHIEAMKPLRCRYVAIGSEACDKSPGYPRDQWCYACDHRDHRNGALALTDEIEAKLRKGSYNGMPQDAVAHALFLLVPDRAPRGKADA